MKTITEGVVGQKYSHYKKCLRIQGVLGIIMILLSLLYLWVSLEISGFLIMVAIGIELLFTKEIVYIP